MSQLLTTGPRHPRLHVSAEWLAALEMLILGPLAAILVLGVIPSALEVEWACTTSLGTTRTAGEDYIAAFAVFGTIGWFGVLVASIFAGIADARRLAAILPVLWFVVLVGAALVVAWTVGPAACP
jgi:hypothetical protein